MTASVSWIASYPRSGNTWLRFLIANCLSDHPFDWTGGLNAFAFELHFYREMMLERGWDEAQTLDKLREVAAGQPTASSIGDQIFVKSHDLWSPTHTFAGHTRRAILLVRDPLDVLLSGLHYARLTRDYNGDDESYIRNYLECGGDPAWIRMGYGSWSQHAKSWMNQDEFPVSVVRYEDLKSNTETELVKICEFLELPVYRHLIDKAAEKSSMERLRKSEVEAREKGQFGGLRDGMFFINQGRSGQNLSDVSPELDDLFEEQFADDMKMFGYDRRTV
ncbi:MAG: sulfotransferase domain-containing protein [Phycisphaerales bacterium]|jgi:aryl sulfotransferase